MIRKTGKNSTTYRFTSLVPGVLVTIASTILISTTIATAQPPATPSGTPTDSENDMQNTPMKNDDSIPADPTSLYKTLKTLPHQITMGTLPNGLTVIVQKNQVAPVATVRCFVRNTGSVYEGKYLGGGVSHVLEHVVAGGTTTKRSEKEIEHIIDTIGGATNAYTSKDVTNYFIDCPAKDVSMAIELIADSMQHIAFAPEEFERELKVVQQELADGEANRGRVLWSLLSQTVYTKHPAKHPIIGYLDVLQGITNEQIIDFYRERYVPNNMVFVVVGDIDVDTVLADIARQFEGTPRGKETLVTLGDEPRQLTPRKTVKKMDGSTYDVVLAWPTIKLSNPDLYALDVAAYILSEGDSSRLVRKLVRQDQIALTVSSASYTPEYVDGYFAVFTVTMPQNYQQTVDEIIQEVYRLKTEPVSTEELAKAKKQKAAELIFGQQTVQQAAESYGRNFLTTADPLFDESYVQGIEQITPEQIMAVAQKYFTPEQLSEIVIAPTGAEEQTLAEAGQTVDQQIHAETLDNGVRVLLKRHESLPMVNMQVFSLGSCLVDTTENAGRASLVAAMLDKGTPNASAEEIADYFDSIGASFGTTAGRNSLIASLTVLADDFPQSADMMTDCVNRPTFPESEFAKVKKLALGQIARRQDNPQAEAFEFFYDNLPDGSPYHVIQGGTKESLEPLTVDDLRAYHEKYFTPQNLVVTVFGDIDIDKALAQVKRQFGDLKPASDFEPITFDRPNQMTGSTVLHKQTGKPTGMVLIGYPAVSIRDEKDYAALTVLDAVTSGYGYPGGWLHTELRGEGLVYGVHAMMLSGPAPGYFMVMAQTSPDNVDEVITRVRKNLEKAKAGEITQDEFDRSKQMIKALHAQDNTTLSQQAQQSALDDLYGLGYNYDKSFDERIDAVTLDDVVRVAKTYLTNSLTVTCSSNGVKEQEKPTEE